MVDSISIPQHGSDKPDNNSYHYPETPALNYELGNPGVIRLNGWVQQMKASFMPAGHADQRRQSVFQLELDQLQLISPKDFFHYLTTQKIANIHLLTHDQLTDHADNFLIQKATKAEANSQKTASFVNEKPLLPSPAVSSYLLQGAAGFFSLWSGVSQKLTAWFVGAKDSKPPSTGTKDSNPVADATHAPKSQDLQSSSTDTTLQNTSQPDSSRPIDPKKYYEPANTILLSQKTSSNDTDANASLVPGTNHEKILKNEALEKKTLPSPSNLKAVNKDSLNLQQTPDLQDLLEENGF